MPDTREYNPLKVVASWATTSTLGVIDILDGSIDGDFLATGKDNTRWSREHDRGGNSTRVKNNNRGGTVSITLSASSPTNDLLSRACKLDDTSENVVGMLTIKDLNGTTVVVAASAYLEDEPDVTFGNARGTRTWVFQSGSVTRFVGGHDVV